LKIPSDFPRPKQRVPLWAVLLAIPVVLFAVGFIAMLTFGAIANEFGITWGDILRSINGTPVHSRSEAIDVVKKLPKDIARVEVVIERDGVLHTYNVDPRDPKVRAAASTVTFKK